MSAPSLWVMAWTIIGCAAQALDEADRPPAGTAEVGSGGIDSVCCDALFANITSGGRVDHRDACTPIATGVIQLYLVRPCVRRGIDPEIPARANDPGVPPWEFNPSTWIPPENTWHYDQRELLADLDALLPRIATVRGPSLDGVLNFGGPLARLDAWQPYLTGPQGTCQGWLFTYRPVSTK